VAQTVRRRVSGERELHDVVGSDFSDSRRVSAKVSRNSVVQRTAALH
jgi:hypothetical protein